MSCYLISADEVFCQPQWQHRSLHTPRTGDYPTIKNTPFVFAFLGGIFSIFLLVYIFGGGHCIFSSFTYLYRSINCDPIMKCFNTKYCHCYWFGRWKYEEESLPVLHQQHEERTEPQLMVSLPLSFHQSSNKDCELAADQNV